MARRVFGNLLGKGTSRQEMESTASVMPLTGSNSPQHAAAAAPIERQDGATFENLERAIKMDNTDSFNQILRNNPDLIHIVNRNGQNLLHIAADSNNCHFIDRILSISSRIDVFARDNENKTFLDYLILRKDEDYQRQHTHTPQSIFGLTEKVRQERKETLSHYLQQFLMQHQVQASSADCAIVADILHRVNTFKDSHLLRADMGVSPAISGQVFNLINTVSPNVLTILSHLSTLQNGIPKHFIDRQISINAQQAQHQAAIDAASQRAFAQQQAAIQQGLAVQNLLQRIQAGEINPNISQVGPGQDTLLHNFALEGNVVGVEISLRAGARTDIVNATRGGTALHRAAVRNIDDDDDRKFQIAQLLLANYQADINLRSAPPKLGTALHRAAESGYSDMVELLIDKGASLKDNSYLGFETPLVTAIRARNTAPAHTKFKYDKTVNLIAEIMLQKIPGFRINGSMGKFLPNALQIIDDIAHRNVGNLTQVINALSYDQNSQNICKMVCGLGGATIVPEINADFIARLATNPQAKEFVSAQLSLGDINFDLERLRLKTTGHGYVHNSKYYGEMGTQTSRAASQTASHVASPRSAHDSPSRRSAAASTYPSPARAAAYPGYNPSHANAAAPSSLDRGGSSHQM